MIGFLSVPLNNLEKTLIDQKATKKLPGMSYNNLNIT